MFILLISIAAVLVLLVFLLPYVLGITLIKLERPLNRRTGGGQSQTIDAETDYLPPDMRTGQSTGPQVSASAAGLRDRISHASPSLKIGLQSQDDSKLRRRRAEKVDLNLDPNTYDYDVDELAREEEEADRKETMAEFRKIQESGITRENLV